MRVCHRTLATKSTQRLPQLISVQVSSICSSSSTDLGIVPCPCYITGGHVTAVALGLSAMALCNAKPVIRTTESKRSLPPLVERPRRRTPYRHADSRKHADRRALRATPQGKVGGIAQCAPLQRSIARISMNHLLSSGLRARRSRDCPTIMGFRSGSRSGLMSVSAGGG